MRAHQEFGGQVADSLTPLFQQGLSGVDKKILHPVTHRVGNRQVVVVQGGGMGGFALFVKKVVGKATLEFVDVPVYIDSALLTGRCFFYWTHSVLHV